MKSPKPSHPPDTPPPPPTADAAVPDTDDETADTTSLVDCQAYEVLPHPFDCLLADHQLSILPHTGRMGEVLDAILTQTQGIVELCCAALDDAKDYETVGYAVKDSLHIVKEYLRCGEHLVQSWRKTPPEIDHHITRQLDTLRQQLQTVVHPPPVNHDYLAHLVAKTVLEQLPKPPVPVVIPGWRGWLVRRWQQRYSDIAHFSGTTRR